jgi:hypothetical protein
VDYVGSVIFEGSYMGREGKGRSVFMFRGIKDRKNLRGEIHGWDQRDGFV